MAKNGKVGDGHRNGTVRERTQVQNPKTGLFVKRGPDGKFMDVKTSGGKLDSSNSQNIFHSFRWMNLWSCKIRSLNDPHLSLNDPHLSLNDPHLSLNDPHSSLSLLHSSLSLPH
jgi:hypothetical protein